MNWWLEFGLTWTVIAVGVWVLFHGAPKAELPRYGEDCGEGCVEGCWHERSLGVIWHSPGCPNLEQGDESG